MGELQSALAVGLEIMLQGMNVFTLDDLAVAAYISSGSCRRAAFAAVQARSRPAHTMATVGAAQLDVHLLCTELAAAESAAA